MQVWAQHVEPQSCNLTEWQVAELIITVPPPLGIKDLLSVEDAFDLVQGFVIKPEFEGAGLPFERVVEALTKRQYRLTCKEPTKIPGLTPEIRPEMQPEMQPERQGPAIVSVGIDYFSGIAGAIEKTYSDAATSITPRGPAPKFGSDAATSITPRGPASAPAPAPTTRPVPTATTARVAPDRAPDRAPTRAPAPVPAPYQADWQAPVTAPPERLDPKTPRGETQFTRRGVENKATFFERQCSGADETNGWNGGPAPATAPPHASANGSGRESARHGGGMKALPDEGCNQMQSGRESARHGGGMKALPPPEALPPPQGQPLLRPQGRFASPLPLCEHTGVNTQGRFASPLPLGSTPPVQSLPRPPPGAPPQLPPAWYMDTDCH